MKMHIGISVGDFPISETPFRPNQEVVFIWHPLAMVVDNQCPETLGLLLICIKKTRFLIYPSHLFRFYSDEITWDIDRQFLWGPGLLISPALEPVGLAGLGSLWCPRATLSQQLPLLHLLLPVREPTAHFCPCWNRKSCS